MIDLTLLKAFSSHSDHDFINGTQHEHPELHTESHSHSHSNSVWFGLMTLIGIIGFLIFERIITILTDFVNRSNHDIDLKVRISF